MMKHEDVSQDSQHFLYRRALISGMAISPLALGSASSAITADANAANQLETAPKNGYSAADALRFHSGPIGSIYKLPPDRMRYVFRNMSEYFRHAVLNHDSSSVLRLSPATGNALGVRDKTIDTTLGNLPLDAWVNHPDSLIDGVLILHKGKIAYEAYPRMDPTDRHILWSVTKTIVGHAVRLLVERGKIDVSRTIGSYIIELRGSGWENVAVRDVLDMQSGIDAVETVPDAFTSPENPYYKFEASIGYLPERLDNRTTYEIMAGYKQRILPGKVFEYSSVNSFVLAWLVERVSGVLVSRFVTENIWRHIGAEADAVWVISPDGAPGADGGISTTLRDLARYGHQYTSMMLGQSKSTVSGSFLNIIQKTGRAESFMASDQYDPADKDTPAFNCWQWDCVWNNGDIYKGGWGGQGLFVSPLKDIVISFFGTPIDDKSMNELPYKCRSIASYYSSSFGV